MISVIVPIYNKEKYILRCVDSILNQTYDNYEIILIDDGSTDNSLNLINEKYINNSHVQIISQANKGVSSARNLGLKYVNGEYVLFVDADDWLNNNYLESININDKYDLILSGYISNQIIESPECKEYTNNVLDEIISELDFKFIKTPWAKLYKAEIIKKNHIVFNENMNYGEDFDFVIKYLSNCNDAIVIDYAGYNYEFIANSLSNKYYDNIVFQMEYLFNDVKNITKASDKTKAIMYYYCTNNILLINRSIKYKKFKKDIAYFCKKNYLGKYYKLSRIISCKPMDKIKIFLLDRKMYSVLFLIYKLINVKVNFKSNRGANKR